MENRPTFNPGDRVVKNPDVWDNVDLDAFGAGKGVGIVAELLIEFDDGDSVYVKWPACRAFQRPRELLLVERP